MPTEEYAERTIRELQIISKLLAFLLCEGKSQNDKVALLSRAGLNTPEIAVLLDLTPNAIRLIRHKAKKKVKAETKTSRD
jgi:hypothetical protein